MDARSIAATAANGGYLTGASELTDVEYTVPDYHFEQGVYDKRVYNGWGHPEPDYALKFGPNIKDWPEQPALTDDLLVKIVSYITDPVTTTDELIPSGETSSFRSNPLRLAEFTLSRKDPAYVPNAKAVKALDEQRKAGELPAEVARVYDDLKKLGYAPDAANTNIGSGHFCQQARATAPPVSRPPAASACWGRGQHRQRVRHQALPLQPYQLGHAAFQLNGAAPFGLGDYILIPHVREALKGDLQNIPAYVLGEEVKPFALYMAPLTSDEREILADGCLINYYKR